LALSEFFTCVQVMSLANIESIVVAEVGIDEYTTSNVGARTTIPAIGTATGTKAGIGTGTNAGTFVGASNGADVEALTGDAVVGAFVGATNGANAGAFVGAIFGAIVGTEIGAIGAFTGNGANAGAAIGAGIVTGVNAGTAIGAFGVVTGTSIGDTTGTIVVVGDVMGTATGAIVDVDGAIVLGCVGGQDGGRGVVVGFLVVPIPIFIPLPLLLGIEVGCDCITVGVTGWTTAFGVAVGTLLIPIPFVLLLESLVLLSYSAVDAVVGPFHPTIWEEGNIVEESIIDVSGLLRELLAKSKVDVGIEVGGIGEGVAIFNGALVSYITSVVWDSGFVEGNALRAVMRFITSGLDSATLINSSIFGEVGVINESTPKTVLTVYEIVVGATDVVVNIHVTSSNVINGVRSNISIIYCSMWAHVTILAAWKSSVVAVVDCGV
jgi:hypothetical protein